MNPCLTNFSKKIVTTGWIPKTMDRPVVAAIAEGWFVQIPLYLLSFFWHTFWCCQISKIIKSIEELVLLSLWFPKICWEKKNTLITDEQNISRCQTFWRIFIRFFAGGKKKPPFSGTGFRVSKSWMKTPPKRLGVNLQKNNAVRGWNLQNTRIVPNPGWCSSGWFQRILRMDSHTLYIL